MKKISSEQVNAINEPTEALINILILKLET